MPSGNSRARSSARRSRLRQITREGQRERRGIVHVAAPAERERPAGALPGGGRIPVERFPHRPGRFEQAGPFASTRPLRDLDGDRGRPSRVAQLAGAGQGQRLQVRDVVFLWRDSFSLPPPTVRVRRRYPSGRRRNTGSRATKRIPASAPPHDARSATHRRGDSGGADCVPCWHTPGSGRDPARGPSRFRRSPTHIGRCSTGRDPRSMCVAHASRG